MHGSSIPREHDRVAVDRLSAVSFWLSATARLVPLRLTESSVQDFTKLEVWRVSRQLTAAVYRLSVALPASEEFGLKSQMRRATISICANIAEGRGRRGDAEFRKFLDYAAASACELECELISTADL